MNRSNQINRSFVILFFLGFCFVRAQINEKNLSEFNTLLSRAAQYRDGESRIVFSRIDSLIQWAIQSPDRIKPFENQMICFLESGATPAGKWFVCQKLSVVGSDTCVPVLSKMLKKEESFDMALFALERNPSPKVNVVLRKQLQKSGGKTRIGLVHALGRRKDEAAVRQLALLCRDMNPDMAWAAVTALGKIATPEAVRNLWDAAREPAADRSLNVKILHALLQSADEMRAQGRQTEGFTILETLMSAEYPVPIRCAAFMEICAGYPEKIPSLLPVKIRGNNPDLKTAAIQQIRQIDDPSLLKQLAQELPQLDSLRQIQLITALSAVGNPIVLKEIVAQTENSSMDVRKAAILALGKLGDLSVVDRLVEFASKEDGLSETARQSLYGLPGQDIDSVLVASLSFAGSAPVKTERIRSIGERRVVDAADKLSGYLSSSDEPIRLEAIRAMGKIASADRMQEMIRILVQAKSRQEQGAAEEAVLSLAQRAGDPDLQVKTILQTAWAIDDVPIKISFVKILGKSGNPQALPFILNAVQDKNLEIQKTAVLALSDWPTAEPMNALVTASQSSNDESLRMLALRGTVRMIDISSMTDDEKASRYQEAFQSSTEWQIKRTVVSHLNGLNSMAAFRLLESCLDISTLRSDAETGILRWTNRYPEKDPVAVKRAMRKIIAASGNSENVNSAKMWLSRLEEKTE